jgi:SulP family sulfate permease
VVAGFVTGLFSIPEGMAYASIGGFNPAVGLYCGLLPTIVGSLTSRTVLMVTTLTSAIALSSQSALKSAGVAVTPGDIAMLTVMVGVVMVLFGVLRFGVIMSFVSNAVMTGFTAGIAVQIIVGVLGDATGYKPGEHNKLVQLGDWIGHIGDWRIRAVTVTLATIAVWAGAWLVKRLRSTATLIALLVVTVVVAIFNIDVELVRDIATVPSSLPGWVTPHFSAAPHLVAGAVAVALVALAQAAGIGAAVPNPDGSRTNLNGDFTAQGLANVAGGLFHALPTGGSLSRTAVAVSAGARSRWSGVFAGVWLGLIVLLFGHDAELIPMPVIGGLILVIGADLLWARRKDIMLVLRTSWQSSAAMVATFLATTQFPLQDAVFIGAGLSLVLFCVRVSEQARLVRLVPAPGGHWAMVAVPERVEPDETLILQYEGVSFFAELARINEMWPATGDAAGATVILSVRGVPDVPSSALIQVFQSHAVQLRRNGGTLMLVGVDGRLARLLDETGTTDVIGADNVFPAQKELFAALDTAVSRAAERRSAQ